MAKRGNRCRSSAGVRLPPTVLVVVQPRVETGIDTPPRHTQVIGVLVVVVICLTIDGEVASTPGRTGQPSPTASAATAKKWRVAVREKQIGLHPRLHLNVAG